MDLMRRQFRPLPGPLRLTLRILYLTLLSFFFIVETLRKEILPMISLIKRMKRPQVITAVLCMLVVTAGSYFELKLPDYMSSLTLLIQAGAEDVSAILNIGLEMLLIVAISAMLTVASGYLSAVVDDVFAHHRPVSHVAQPGELLHDELKVFFARRHVLLLSSRLRPLRSRFEEAEDPVVEIGSLLVGRVAEAVVDVQLAARD